MNTSKANGKNLPLSHQPGCHLPWREVEEPAGVERGGDWPPSIFTLSLSLLSLSRFHFHFQYFHFHAFT